MSNSLKQVIKSRTTRERILNLEILHTKISLISNREKFLELFEKKGADNKPELSHLLKHLLAYMECVSTTNEIKNICFDRYHNNIMPLVNYIENYTEDSPRVSGERLGYLFSIYDDIRLLLDEIETDEPCMEHYGKMCDSIKVLWELGD